MAHVCRSSNNKNSIQSSPINVNEVYAHIPGTHLSFVLPPNEGPFQSKQGSFGFQVIVCHWVQ